MLKHNHRQNFAFVVTFINKLHIKFYLEFVKYFT